MAYPGKYRDSFTFNIMREIQVSDVVLARGEKYTLKLLVITFNKILGFKASLKRGDPLQTEI